MKRSIFVAVIAALALAGCAPRGGSQPVHIVGSSTVYPFTTAVAEHFQRATRDISVIVESTGTGGGMKLFCSGVGDRFPDMVNASRRIKSSELADCLANGVEQVIEIPVGIDGLALIESVTRGAGLQLTVREVYEALAANPYGRLNRTRRWSDVNPALPDVPIRVYGPPPTSGTRDSFAELVMEKGCETDPEMRALKEGDRERFTTLCTQIREDGAFIEAGENDNLLVQKVYQEPGAVGILGFSFLEENLDRVRGIPMNGVAPTAETIGALDYPGARQMFLYAKGEHLDVIAGMREFLIEYARSWVAGGYLSRRGLIPSPEPVQERARRAIIDARPLTAEELA